MTYLKKEILEQPQVLSNLLKTEGKRIAGIAKAAKKADIHTIFLVARGSSDNAGLYGKYLFGSRNRRVVALATPSLFTLYKQAPDLTGCLVLAISQSGESHDLLQVVEEGKRQGARTLVITNRAKSPLARVAEHVIPVHAGRERSVAATKTYTAELMALAMLSAALRGSKKDREDLRKVPGAVRKVLDDKNCAATLAAAQRYRYTERLSVIGRGYNYATAFELSLKLKELAYLTAEPSSSADFRHGPIAMVERGFPVLLIAPKGKVFKDMLDLARQLLERQAELVAISDNRQLLSLAQTALPIRSGLPEWLTPVVAVVPGQLFAMGLAQARGCSLDKPRGLSKVTRTR
jgi:glucosamine--fructose-6-phosphate aminotransferase (isomerizing)